MITETNKNCMISIEITSDSLNSGFWWAYVTQKPDADHPDESKIRKIGRKFKTNYEAWQWAMRKVSAIQGPTR